MRHREWDVPYKGVQQFPQGQGHRDAISRDATHLPIFAKRLKVSEGWMLLFLSITAHPMEQRRKAFRYQIEVIIVAWKDKQAVRMRRTIKEFITLLGFRKWNSCPYFCR